MRALIRRCSRPRFERQGSAFFLLTKTIVYQQLSGHVAAVIFQRLLARCDGARRLTPAAVLAVPSTDLRAAGLSERKASYVRGLAAAFADGTIRPHRLAYLADDEIRELLGQVRGVGRWTADMFLIFGLARPDVLPVDDLGIRTASQGYFGLEERPDESTLRELAEPWRPFRSVASWYLWRSLESAR